MKGKRWIVISAGLFVLAAVLLGGCGALTTVPASSGDLRLMSSAEGSGVDRPTISVRGHGVASAPPDVARISLRVESVSEDADEAIRDNNQRAQAVIEAATRLGVERKDIQTVDYSLWIEERHDDNGWPTGERRYHVLNAIVIRLHEIDKTGQLLGDVIAAGANNIDGISFGVSDTGALADEARREAVAEARAKAEAMAEALGVQVGDVIYVSDSGYTPPIDVRMVKLEELEANGAAPVPIESGTFSVEVNVTVLFAIDQ